jgi:Icc-related predicted phosphoesterase
MKILFLSDTHAQHRSLQNLPDTDILIHGGDVSRRKGEKPSEKSEHDVLDFIEWFCSLDYKHKIFIAGNHDVYFANKTESDESIGCADLLQAVQKIRPKLHLFGHVHERHGKKRPGETIFVNGSVMDEEYKMMNNGVVVEIRF